MLYRKLQSDDANRVLRFCDDNKIHYDLWNSEDFWLSYGKNCAEIGLSEKDWITVDNFLAGMIK